MMKQMTNDDFKYKTIEDMINILELFNDELQECKEKIKQLETKQFETKILEWKVIELNEKLNKYGAKN